MFFGARIREFAQRTNIPVTTYGNPNWQILRQAERNTASEKLLETRLQQARDSLLSRYPGEFKRLIELQNEGIVPNKDAAQGSKERELAALQTFIKDETLLVNRFPGGTIALLGPQDYFTLTPFTPPPQPGYQWRDDQILIHSIQEFRELTQTGISLMKGNQVLPGVANACFGLPLAGVASRALAFAKAHPELVEKVRQLGALEGLQEGELPPRFLYPIQTDIGVQTLAGIMLANTGRIGRDLQVLIPSLLLLNGSSSALTMRRLDKEPFAWTEQEKNSMLLFTQSVAARRYLSDGKVIEGQLFPTGHGDYPNLLARYNIYNFLLESGIDYLFFANGDEFCWSVNPTILEITNRLVRQGYAGICFVVPNTNNQSGGGAVKDIVNPDNKFLVEMPCMSANLIQKGKFPLGLNTTFYVFSVRALAELTLNLLTLQPALDIKAVDGRNGGIELAASLESWAGCEFTAPFNRPHNFETAFVFAPRSGFFLGIKSLDHTHSPRTPEEFMGHPRFGHFTYETYIQYIANSFPEVMRGIMQGDPAVLQRVFEAGGSYLI